MISVIDCAMGNIAAFLNIYKRLNIPARAATSPSDIEGAEKLILPGVGAFDWAMEKFNGSGLRPAVEAAVLERRVPVLGICIGMHMLGAGSEEGHAQGLGWIEGDVKKFRPTDSQLPLPHMGWNDVAPQKQMALFEGLEDEAQFYFLHSYYFAPGVDETVLSVTNYGAPFASAVGADNIYGVQFHPEKSHQSGIRLLKNFAEI